MTLDLSSLDVNVNRGTFQHILEIFETFKEVTQLGYFDSQRSPNETINVINVLKYFSKFKLSYYIKKLSILELNKR